MKLEAFPVKKINESKITLDENGNVFSEIYKDIYHQPNIAISEKSHVFLQGNDLPNKWKNKEQFTIAELGFGVGINFLNTIKAWDKAREKGQYLYYISYELSPFSRESLRKLLESYQEFACYKDELVEKYPKFLTYGLHRIVFNNCNVILTLVFADAALAIDKVSKSTDVWYLDGFSPSKNLDMWDENIIRKIANKSKQGTTLSTYSVAGHLRKNLIKHGFSVKKVKGFGQKREMLTAVLNKKEEVKEKLPWYVVSKPKKTTKIVVVGAGIAGLSIADSLSNKGKDVTLIDSNERPCMEASGNPQAMVMPAMSLNDSNESRFYFNAFFYAIKNYKQAFNAVGVRQLAKNSKDRSWQTSLMNRYKLPTNLLKQSAEALYYPKAGWVDTKKHVENILSTLEGYIQAKVKSIQRKKDQWIIGLNNGRNLKADVLVLANAMGIGKLLPKYETWLTPKKGEISIIDASEDYIDTKYILLNKGYIMPRVNNRQIFGATFQHIEEKLWFEKVKTSQEHWQKNKQFWLDTEYKNIVNKLKCIKSRAGIRVTTPDHLPVCGAVIDQELFKKDYHDISHGKHWLSYPNPKVVEGLYIITGLGSRGYTSAPILAEYLTNLILDEPNILPIQLQKSINPNRFLFRRLKKSVT